MSLLEGVGKHLHMSTVGILWTRLYMHSTKVKVAEDIKRYLHGFYWMPKLHKNPYGHCFVAASASCATKPLSKLLTHWLQLILKDYTRNIAKG